MTTLPMNYREFFPYGISDYVIRWWVRYYWHHNTQIAFEYFAR